MIIIIPLIKKNCTWVLKAQIGVFEYVIKLVPKKLVPKNSQIIAQKYFINIFQE